MSIKNVCSVKSRKTSFSLLWCTNNAIKIIKAIGLKLVGIRIIHWTVEADEQCANLASSPYETSMLGGVVDPVNVEVRVHRRSPVQRNRKCPICCQCEGREDTVNNFHARAEQAAAKQLRRSSIIRRNAKRDEITSSTVKGPAVY